MLWIKRGLIVKAKILTTRNHYLKAGTNKKSNLRLVKPSKNRSFSRNSDHTVKKNTPKKKRVTKKRTTKKKK